MAKKTKTSYIVKTEKNVLTNKPDRFWIWFVVAGGLAVTAIIALFVLDSQQPSARTSSGGAVLDEIVILPDPGAGHVDGDIDYPQSETSWWPHIIQPGLNCGNL